MDSSSCRVCILVYKINGTQTILPLKDTSHSVQRWRNEHDKQRDVRHNCIASHPLDSLSPSCAFFGLVGQLRIVPAVNLTQCQYRIICDNFPPIRLNLAKHEGHNGKEAVGNHPPCKRGVQPQPSVQSWDFGSVAQKHGSKMLMICCKLTLQKSCSNKQGNSDVCDPVSCTIIQEAIEATIVHSGRGMLWPRENVNLPESTDLFIL